MHWWKLRLNKIFPIQPIVSVAMLVYITIAKKVFWEFDSIIMQNLSDILPLCCTPIWPSHHVSENQESDHCLVALALSLST